MDENLWQLRALKEAELRGGILEQQKSGLHDWIAQAASDSDLTTGHVVHKDSDRFDLDGSLIGLSQYDRLENEMIAFRHRGQGIEPGGPEMIVEVALVEQR